MIRVYTTTQQGLVVKNVIVNVGAGDENYNQVINNAVINDHEGNFSASNFVPLFYWSYPEQGVIRILHTNKAEYEVVYEEDGETVQQLYGADVYAKVSNPSNISLRSSGGDPYEYCT